MPSSAIFVRVSRIIDKFLFLAGVVPFGHDGEIGLLDSILERTIDIFADLCIQKCLLSVVHQVRLKSA